MLPDLSPQAILALSRMLSKPVIEAARAQVEAGDYDVECVVHLRGELEVEEDTKAPQVNRLQPMLLFKLAMDKLNGVSVDAIVSEAVEILKTREAESEDEEDDGEDPVMKEFKAKTNQAYKRLAQATLQPRRGAVTFQGEISGVEP